MKNYKDLSLTEIIKLSQKDDKNALNELVRRYQQKIHNSFAKLDNNADISDLTQETLFRITKSIKNLKNPDYFPSWLNRITTNIFYDFLRKKNKITTYTLQIGHNSIEADNEDFMEIEDNSSTPHENSLSKELQEKIKDAIKDLPLNFKSIIILREIKGLSYNKIASLTNTNIGTIKSRLSRAREKLQEELNEYLK